MFKNRSITLGKKIKLSGNQPTEKAFQEDFYENSKNG